MLNLNPNHWGLIIIGAVLCILITVFSLPTWLAPPELDDAGCPVDSEAKFPSTIVFIDQTDPLTPAQSRELADLVNTLTNGFRVYEKVSVYPIRADRESEFVPLFEHCNPGNPDNINPLYGNPRMVRNVFNQEFAKPFQDALTAEAVDASATDSPILETIETVVNNHMLDARVSDMRLVIVSDLLQNMPNYSHYRHGYSYSHFSQERGEGYETGPYLTMVDVDLFYLWRRNISQAQLEAHIQFWEEYFTAAGATISSLQKVR